MPASEGLNSYGWTKEHELAARKEGWELMYCQSSRPRPRSPIRGRHEMYFIIRARFPVGFGSIPISSDEEAVNYVYHRANNYSPLHELAVRIVVQSQMEADQ